MSSRCLLRQRPALNKLLQKQKTQNTFLGICFNLRLSLPQICLDLVGPSWLRAGYQSGLNQCLSSIFQGERVDIAPPPGRFKPINVFQRGRESGRFRCVDRAYCLWKNLLSKAPFQVCFNFFVFYS